MLLSIVIITRDRRDQLLQSLARLKANLALAPGEYELLIVDNASCDDTLARLHEHHPDAITIPLEHNEGMPARNHAIRRASGQFVLILDDDSYPAPQTVERAIDYMQHNPQCGAVTGRVELPTGALEASAMPTVFIGCATLLRREALDTVGLFDPVFFRQAEEYDLSFRLWQAGYAIERFEDLVFYHDKHPGGRPSALTVRMDIRNNLILADRYLPEPERAEYQADWIQRYTAIGQHLGEERALRRGIWEARWHHVRHAIQQHAPFDTATFEVVFEQELIALRIADWALRHRVRHVVIADLAKNMYGVWRACQQAGLSVIAVADNAPAFFGLSYRNVPVTPDEKALSADPQGIILANMNPARVDARRDQLHAKYPGPVLSLWHPRKLYNPDEFLEPHHGDAA